MIPGGYLSGTRWIWYIVGESGVCGLILPSAVQCSAVQGRKERRKEWRKREDARLLLWEVTRKNGANSRNVCEIKRGNSNCSPTVNSLGTQFHFLPFFLTKERRFKFRWLFVTGFKLSEAILWFYTRNRWWKSLYLLVYPHDDDDAVAKGLMAVGISFCSIKLMALKSVCMLAAADSS